MNMKKLMESWEKDSKYDETELGEASTNIPRIHSKYLNTFLAEKLNLKRIQQKMNKLKLALVEYYSGDADEDDLEKLGYQQFYKRVDKKDLQLYIEANDEYQDLEIELSNQTEKVSYLESILKSIGNRNWEIRNAIEWNRFTSGG